MRKQLACGTPQSQPPQQPAGAHATEQLCSHREQGLTQQAMLYAMVLHQSDRDPLSPAPVVQFWRQEWAWTEAGMAQAKAVRDGRPGGSSIAHEPIFCLESCAMCLLWSELVYRPDGAEVMPQLSRLHLGGCMAGEQRNTDGLHS